MGRKSQRIRLNVFLDQKPVGMLERSASGEISFVYDMSWLEAQRSFPISYSLPLRDHAYRGEIVSSYFDNLLPDNDTVRKAIAARTGAPSTGSVDLLAALGRDCVGALQFFPESSTPGFRRTPKVRTLSEREIATQLRSLEKTPLGVTASQEFRISIAGAQEKTAFLLHRGIWCLPLEATPTSHIFKVRLGKLPNGIDLSTSIENEWFCLRVAAHLGLSVTAASLAQFEDVDCLIVERFDRRKGTAQKTLMRLPQEDLCQALGVPSTRKYESDGGPGIPQIMNFLDASDVRNADRSTFFRAQLVFFLLGATDGHAKNFSIFLSQSGFQLTPLYDILTVAPALRKRQLERKDAKLAMCVGESRHYRLSEIRLRHWEQTAKKCGFASTQLAQLIQDLSLRVKTLPSILTSLPEHFPAELAEAVVEYVAAQMKILEG